jgi:hypothetical protein
LPLYQEVYHPSLLLFRELTTHVKIRSHCTINGTRMAFTKRSQSKATIIIEAGLNILLDLVCIDEREISQKFAYR